MQKFVNVLAVASSVVSLAVVGSGLYVYVNEHPSLMELNLKLWKQLWDLWEVLEDWGGGSSLPLGTPDLAPPSGSALTSPPTPPAS